MSITPKQLAELEKKLSSVQNPTYSVAELCSFDDLVNQLMPALIAAARELHNIKVAQAVHYAACKLQLPVAPPGCDFPDPPIEEKSTFILDHPDPA